MNIADIKKEFPIFETHPDLVYLDNAASTQKPRSVIEAELDFYRKSNANVHRGIYALSEEATDLYETARDTVANFVNAKREEIIFTSGTTDSINGIARSLELSEMINPEPDILLTELEHHANILPWQRMRGLKQLKYIPVGQDFKLDLNNLNTSQFDLLAISHISNVTGTLNDIDEVASLSSKPYVVVDAAQSVAHMQLDMQSWAADFAAFSGHKIYGPTGIGVLYGKKELFEKMEPFRVGGGMITEVRRDSATWAETPTKFEAGTPPIAQAIGLDAAIKFIQQLGWENIQSHEQILRKYALEQLNTISGIRIFHPPASETHGGVISFEIEGLHAHDVSQVLSESNIAVRAGHHCTHVLHREVLNAMASIRISFGVYNEINDVDRLVTGLNKAKEILK